MIFNDMSIAEMIHDICAENRELEEKVVQLKARTAAWEALQLEQYSEQLELELELAKVKRRRVEAMTGHLRCFWPTADKELSALLCENAIMWEDLDKSEQSVTETQDNNEAEIRQTVSESGPSYADIAEEVNVDEPVSSYALEIIVKVTIDEPGSSHALELVVELNIENPENTESVE